VRKWIYASYYEHFFAVRAIGALFRSTEWQTALLDETKAMVALIDGASFIWAPLEHHDHWHVVFDRTAGGSSSLGPDPFTLNSEALEKQLRMWTALGVDLVPLAKELAGRRITDTNLFEKAAQERQAILALLKPYVEERTPSTEVERRKARQAAFVKELADAIGQASYQDIPSLKETHYKDWVRNSPLGTRHAAPAGPPPKEWKRWDSDTKEPALQPDRAPGDDGADDG
jgi:hypothetical protein